MAMTVDKFALLVIFFNGSFFLNCCHVEKMTHKRNYEILICGMLSMRQRYYNKIIIVSFYKA